MSSKNSQAQKQEQQVQSDVKLLASDQAGTATPELIAQHLDNYSRTADGSLAFTDLDLSNQKISNITLLSQYPHLQVINLSHNQLSDITALSSPSLGQIHSLNLSHNLITSPNISVKEPLQFLDLSFNQIAATDPTSFSHPNLQTLLLHYNQLKQLFGLDSPSSHIQVFDASHNNLTDAKGLPPYAKKINLSHNSITSLAGLGKCVQLTHLNLSHNKITTAEGIDLSSMLSLIEIDLSFNSISDASALIPLSQLPSLRRIILRGNPIMPAIATDVSSSSSLRSSATNADADPSSDSSTASNGSVPASEDAVDNPTTSSSAPSAVDATRITASMDLSPQALLSRRTAVLRVLPALSHIDGVPVSGAERSILLASATDDSAGAGGRSGEQAQRIAQALRSQQKSGKGKKDKATSADLVPLPPSITPESALDDAEKEMAARIKEAKKRFEKEDAERRRKEQEAAAAAEGEEEGAEEED